jgi:uncharacterized protein (TIGR02145 family)
LDIKNQSENKKSNKSTLKVPTEGENLEYSNTKLIDIKSIIIGEQKWTLSNLDVINFRNGDPITEAKTPLEWDQAETNGKPAWCHYNNDPANDIMYGKLYNWFSVNDIRGLAPAGWHVPSDDEWIIIIQFLGGQVQAPAKMKGTSGWGEKNGYNTSFFSALPLPIGYRKYDGSYKMELSAYFWSSTQNSTETSFGYTLSRDIILQYQSRHGSGFSVRCIKD